MKQKKSVLEQIQTYPKDEPSSSSLSTFNVVDEEVEAVAQVLDVDPRTVMRWLGGLEIRGRVGRRITAYMLAEGYVPNPGRKKAVEAGVKATKKLLSKSKGTGQ